MYRLANECGGRTAAGSAAHCRCHPGRVLVVDDDPAIRQRIMSFLNERDCCAIGSDGSDALQKLERVAFSLVVLDIQLGPLDGLDLLRQIRMRSDVPVIVLSEPRDDEIDRVIGLELGADDYIDKLCDFRELLARARAILRRQDLGRHAAPPARGGFRFSGWELCRRRRTLSNPAGEAVNLTKKEYALLVAFLEASGRPLSRNYLLQATSTHWDIFDRSIDVQVLRLRRKLKLGSSNLTMIRTERGFGYSFDASVEVLF